MAATLAASFEGETKGATKAAGKAETTSATSIMQNTAKSALQGDGKPMGTGDGDAKKRSDPGDGSGEGKKPSKLMDAMRKTQVGKLMSRARTALSNTDPKETIGRIVIMLLNVIFLACFVALLWFFYSNPPRPGGPHNFAQGQLNATAQSFEKTLVKFWEFYGERMSNWWNGLTTRAKEGDADAVATLKAICDAWRDRGRRTVFNHLYLRANKSRVSVYGDDYVKMFYRYPGRRFEDRDLLEFDLSIDRNESAVEWPRISTHDTDGNKIHPYLDFRMWFDLSAFDPRQTVVPDDPAFDLKGFMRRMRAVERFDLFAVAIPRFLDHIDAENALYRHVPINDIDDTLSFFRDHGADYEQDNPPEVVLRWGVKNVNEKCLQVAADRLATGMLAMDSSFVKKVHMLVSGSPVIARSIAKNAEPGLLVNLEVLTPRQMVDRIRNIDADKDTPLFYAARAVRAWSGVKEACERLVEGLRGRYLNTLLIKTFIRETSRVFENAVGDLLTATRMGDVEGVSVDRNSMAAEYTLWHNALDILRAVEDDSLSAAIAELKNMAVNGNPDTAINSENPLISGCTDKQVYKLNYDAYVNAVKCAIYAETYVDDAKLKFNVRYTNPLAAENFYNMYFEDLYKAYWAKDTYKGIPRSDCNDCFEPHLSPLGQVYNIESLKERTIRFWQSRGGIGRELVENFKLGVTKALRNAMTDCEVSMAFVRKMLGEEFDGKGYYGGKPNRVMVYTVSKAESPVFWNVRSQRWQSHDTLLQTSWYWEDVKQGSDIVFEDCVQGGTVIYSRYAHKLHKKNCYLTADDKGQLKWDNLFQVNDLNFSGCMHGLTRKIVEKDTILTKNSDMGGADEIPILENRTREFSEDDAYMRAKDIMEEFAVEPACGSDESRDVSMSYPDYCYFDEFGSEADIGQAGLFQIIDVTDPPDRMNIGAVRNVLIVSRGKRCDNPLYANRRLLTLGYDIDREKIVPTLIDDTSENRGLAVLMLTVTSVSTSGPVVLGINVKDNTNYPYFLNRDAKSQSVERLDKWRNLWIALAFIATYIVASSLLPITGGMSLGLAIGVSVAVGFRLPSQKIGMLRETGNVITNVLDKSNNPFRMKEMRYMLVLEKPGLWPEFSLVPYTKPSQTIGSDYPTEETPNPEARLVPRDSSGATRVVFIPAIDTNINSEKLLHPPMITEHEKDNFSKVGTAFYIYSPGKRMFLVAEGDGGGKVDAIRWINADGDPRKTKIKIRLKGTDKVFDVYKESDNSQTRVQLWSDRDSDNQKFERVYEDAVDNTPIDLLRTMPFKLKSIDSGKCLVANKDTNGLSSLVQFYCEKGDLFSIDGEHLKVGDKYVQAEKVNGKLTGWLKYSVTKQFIPEQMFVIESAADCGESLMYTDRQIIEGVMPGSACIKPWYVYELNPNELTQKQAERMDKTADDNA